MTTFDLGNIDVEWVASKSFRNCHAIGVDSLLFRDTPGNVIRAFVCRPEHELWTNDPSRDLPFSVGLHAHHCDVTLAPIYGEAYNVTNGYGPHAMLRAYEYQSAITGTSGTSGTFTKLGYSRGFNLEKTLISSPLSLRARDIHTIYVPQGQGAAWFVIEGAENPRYRPVTYSNAELEGMDFSGMYQPMDAEEVRLIVNKIKALGPKIEVPA